ncbi:PAS domain-containing sensor histidine kinase [Sphingomonas lutea]|uniref:histidine kinase n=1 Tax=Sphingomonas lutea TaxID=1045317 RepID=A0A7G9SFX9_9SPHN|nr:HAMP domain-containing sensor histidine kinase [Sphingomonas lutea]QNN66754.1 PAS domain-containing sensor histidine kinase [Sphingomonas lutea]
MASAPSEPRAVRGRIDKAGRLVEAEPDLEALQRDAGSALGKRLAVPQIAAVAQLARKLGIAVSRHASAAAADHDVELRIHATPDGDDVLLSIDGWERRPAAAPRLANLLGGPREAEASQPRHEWAADEELRVISLSPELADYLGVDPADAAGQPLTRVVRMDEDEDGEMPLIASLAARRPFTGQPARSRADDSRTVLLSGDVVSGADGNFAGFQGTADLGATAAPDATQARTAAFDHALDEALRSPLDRIIESAERILDRSDGPLRSDYASYGSDIAAAARHLLSVVQSMSDDPTQGQVIDLAALAAEAVVMVEPAAEERNITIVLESARSLPASGEERAVIQILVNLMNNAVRHSPEGGEVTLTFVRTEGTASLTVTDQGAGIDAADQQRIFERFERADPREGGTGLGLAISRRLARSMGGDVTLESAPGIGARFTLTLPAS